MTPACDLCLASDTPQHDACAHAVIDGTHARWEAWIRTLAEDALRRQAGERLQAIRIRRWLTTVH